MKYILCNFFNVNNSYALNIKQIRLNDKSKIVDYESNYRSNMVEDVKTYLKNFKPEAKFKKAKVYFNYITNNIICELINKTTLSINIKKSEVKKHLDELYPSFDLNYYCELENITYKDNIKMYLMRLIPKEIEDYKHLELYFTKKYTFKVDVLALNEYIEKFKMYFKNKRILLVEHSEYFIRYTEIMYGNIVSFMVLDKQSKEFNVLNEALISKFDNSYDEIVVENDFKEYVKLCEMFPLENVLFCEHIDKLRGIDEKKIITA